MKNLIAFKDYGFLELNKQDLMNIYGGAPSKDTSFAYDVLYYVGVFFRSAYEMGKAARGNPHI